ncbi:MAG: Ig-like domain-containing protein [Candidatus Omnitrophota bacterium]|nr:Ig-like domain-containing protein [Candidatus Omnitrophota bacterium]
MISPKSTLILFLTVFFSLGMAPKPPDNIAPQVSITVPSNNATISGIVNIQAQATDNRGVSKVEIYVDNALKATGYAASASYAWDTSASPNAAHTLKAIATDKSNNTAQAQINVTVNNAVPPTPGGVGGQVPVSLSVVSSFSNINKSAAQAIDNNLSTYWQGQYSTFFGRKTFTSWWLRLDLGKPYDLAKISIFWDKAYGAANYSIQGSNDYTTWANLQTNLSSAGGSTNPNQKDHLITGTYQHIRVFINKAQLLYPRVYEVKIYRVGAPPDTQGPTLEITSPKDGEVIR